MDIETRQQETELVLPKQRNRWVMPLAVTGALAIACGTGYYAYKASGERDDARALAAELQRDNQSLTDALELHRSAKVDLTEQLTSCKGDLDSEKVGRVEADTQLTACRESVEDLEEQEREAKAMLDEFNTLTARFRKMIDSGKLDVVFRRGQMIVKLPAQVLFPSGSATLSKGGEEALAEVAKILRTMRRKFTVAGHTDNVPIRSAEFGSNWELSTARAVTVVRMLIENGVKPRTLIAAGYGPYAPIASNKTDAGRRKNRRIEIILEPDLRKLPLGKLRKQRKTARKGKRRR